MCCLSSESLSYCQLSYTGPENTFKCIQSSQAWNRIMYWTLENWYITFICPLKLIFKDSISSSLPNFSWSGQNVAHCLYFVEKFSLNQIKKWNMQKIIACQDVNSYSNKQIAGWESEMRPARYRHQVLRLPPLLRFLGFHRNHRLQHLHSTRASPLPKKQSDSCMLSPHSLVTLHLHSAANSENRSYFTYHNVRSKYST